MHTVIVLGNGPSINNVNFDKCAEYTTIGVNCISRAFDPDYLLFLDQKSWEKYGTYIQSSTAKKYFYEGLDVPLAGTLFKEFNGPSVLSNAVENGLYFSHTSIFPAINLAIIFGAQRVVMLGVDMTDNSHFYSDKNNDKGFPDFKRIKKDFERLADSIRGRGIRIENGNSESAIDIFPFTDEFNKVKSEVL